MDKQRNVKARVVLLGRALWVIIAAWTGLLGVSLYLSLRQVSSSVHESALVEARITHQQAVLTRTWATDHGGVYVLVTKQTRPNPNLAHVLERDLTTPSGRRLTLITPPDMTRQIHNLGYERHGTHNHITSLTPLRPENAPDAWERSALERFARGVKEATAIEVLNGEPHLRLMRPFIVDLGCLTCHAGEGHRVGDVRGGVSVAVRLADFAPLVGSHNRLNWLSHGITWMVGVLGLVLGGALLRRRLAERDAAETRYRGLFERANDAIYLLDPETLRIRDCNERASTMLGRSREQLQQMTALELHPAEERERAGLPVADRAVSALATFNHLRGDGAPVPVEISRGLIEVGGERLLLCIVRDITERRWAELANVQLEAQLRQAQKMEAVGQLAGGVAHDFNNLLTVIDGNAQLLAENATSATSTTSATSAASAERAESAELIGEIREAAARAARLTRQLLAFSRRQVMQLRRLDLNEVVAGVRTMLGRVLGETVEICCQPAAELPPVAADAAMLDQVIVNLAVNARDAMSGGGRLTITTGVETLCDEDHRRSADARAGRFVTLAVSDSGCGMDQPTLARIFEPFFTTKEIGKGTGLGLATVYGILKQHHGWVEVTSSPGAGSTFKAYLPAADASVAEDAGGDGAALPDTLGGTETILVVEDDEPVRQVVLSSLRRLGYQVLAAADGAAALGVWREHEPRVDLLLTDMVMPGGMSGQALAERLRESRPGLRVVFCSGYSHEALAADIVRGDNFLPKPFDQQQLARVVRRCLDAPPLSPNQPPSDETHGPSSGAGAP